jgi:pimeloyl-ACP methyl ester carboxylesterase
VDSKHRFSLNISSLIHPDDMISINFPRLLGRITCPALFISADPELGAASDGADISRIKEWIPHIQVAHVANAGHSIRRDQFSSYLEIVQGFLLGLA